MTIAFDKRAISGNTAGPNLPLHSRGMTILAGVDALGSRTPQPRNSASVAPGDKRAVHGCIEPRTSALHRPAEHVLRSTSFAGTYIPLVTRQRSERDHCTRTLLWLQEPWLASVVSGSTIRKHLDRAAYRMMQPIARFLLRFGMTANEFANLSRSAFVHAAAEEYLRAGKKPNYSRIAVKTALTRPQVREYLNREWQDVRSYEWHRHRTTRVLSGWHQDPDFVDANGKPLELDFEGPGSTFRELCQRYSGDIGPRAMLDELLRVKAVKETADGKVRVLARTYRAERVDIHALMHFADTVYDLVSTLDRNLHTPDAKPLFEGVVSTPRLNPKMLPIFRRRVAERGQKFLEMLDEWLSREELPEGGQDTAEEGVRAGVAIYFFEEDNRDTRSKNG